MTDFKTIPLKDIHPDPNQPRKFYDQAAMDELTESVKSKGVLQPILVRPNAKGYVIVCGERRFKAALSIQAAFSDRNTIPAMVREMDDQEALELQIIENLQRKDVHPMEEAVAFKSLIDHKQLDVKEIAARIGKKDFYVKQRLKLNDLITEWQDAFFRNRISLSEVLKVCVFDKKAQKSLYEDEAYGTGTISLSTYDLQKYLGSLSKASFDLTDPFLDKKAGPCTSCQFNSSVSLLFPEHANTARCNNIVCYKNKTDLHFSTALQIAKEDPAIIFIEDSYSPSGTNKLISGIRKEGFDVLNKQRYSQIDPPEKPDWEEFKEDNEDDYVLREDDLKKAFNKELDEYEDDLKKYQAKVASSKYKKSFMLDGDDQGKYIFIEVKKGTASSSTPLKASSTKQDIESASIADIDAEITRIREREKRNKELDAEKVHAVVTGILQNSKEFTSVKRDCNLTENEVIAAAAALFTAGSYDFKKWLGKKFGTDSYTLKAANIEKLKGLTYFGLNEIIWHFILDKLMENAGSRLVSGNALCVHNIAADYHGAEVSAAVSDQEQRAIKRAERADKRIKDLQDQKKLLQAQAKQKPAKSAKK